uniref:Uncharacterized protein n=1 Tax=Oryza brachyantha TaxID=4533 RepID=J3MEW6_ORYBR
MHAGTYVFHGSIIRLGVFRINWSKCQMTAIIYSVLYATITFSDFLEILLNLINILLPV